jgi:hypothetical protein
VGVARVAVVAAAVACGCYLAPRVVDLVRIPDVLGEAVGHARSYNPLLPRTAAFDEQSTAQLAALDRVDTALARVAGTNARVLGELRVLISGIRADLLPLLGRTDAEVAELVGSLDRLEGALTGVRGSVDDATSAAEHDRRRLDRALRTAEAVAEQVRAARGSATRAADNVSGPGR